MIGILNYGLGNIGAIKNVFDESNIEVKIMLTPTHPMLFTGCKNYKNQFTQFFNRLKKFANKNNIEIHGSFFPEDLGDPNEVAAFIKFDGHHINRREGFKFIK